MLKIQDVFMGGVQISLICSHCPTRIFTPRAATYAEVTIMAYEEKWSHEQTLSHKVTIENVHYLA